MGESIGEAPVWVRMSETRGLYARSLPEAAGSRERECRGAPGRAAERPCLLGDVSTGRPGAGSAEGGRAAGRPCATAGEPSGRGPVPDTCSEPGAARR